MERLKSVHEFLQKVPYWLYLLASVLGVSCGCKFHGESEKLKIDTEPRVKIHHRDTVKPRTEPVVAPKPSDVP